MEVVIAAGDADCAAVAILDALEDAGQYVASRRIPRAEQYHHVFLHAGDYSIQQE